MNEKINSDKTSTPTMLANNMFESIINHIRHSNLNFQLQLSPFSAQISLKKSFITEKSGVLRLPPPAYAAVPNANLEKEVAALVSKNIQLENDLLKLKCDYAHSVDDCHEAHEKIRVLEAEIVKKESDDAPLDSDYEFDKLKIDSQAEEISGLKSALKVKDEIAKKMSELKIKTKQESAQIERTLRSEIKSWRKELGDERKEKHKLQMKLENITVVDENKNKKKASHVKSKNKTDTITKSNAEEDDAILCSICASYIEKHIPVYFCGTKMSPTCEGCKASDSSLTTPADPFASFSTPYQPTSLVSHWNPHDIKIPQRPSSIISMVSHCAVFPPPGSSFISMEEVLEMLGTFLEEQQKMMRECFDSLSKFGEN